MHRCVGLLICPLSPCPFPRGHPSRHYHFTTHMLICSLICSRASLCSEPLAGGQRRLEIRFHDVCGAHSHSPRRCLSEMSVSAFEARLLGFLLRWPEDRPLSKFSESHIKSTKDRISAKYHIGDCQAIDWNQDRPVLEICKCSTPFHEFDRHSEVDCTKLPSGTNRSVCACWVGLQAQDLREIGRQK